jgi:Alkyl sulfatase and related hydrolases
MRSSPNRPRLPAGFFAGDVQLQGSLLKFREMMSCMDDFDPWFNIVTP